MERLEQILRTMDIPEQRMNDCGWLMRNLAIRNGDHEDFSEAMTLIRKQHSDNNRKQTQ